MGIDIVDRQDPAGVEGVEDGREQAQQGQGGGGFVGDVECRVDPLVYYPQADAAPRDHPGVEGVAGGAQIAEFAFQLGRIDAVCLPQLPDMGRGVRAGIQFLCQAGDFTVQIAQVVGIHRIVVGQQ